MNKKKLAVIVILVVIAAIIVGVMGFEHKAKAPAAVVPVTTPTGVTVQASSTGSSTVSVVLSTSTQQFYANGSFSFNYPVSWSIAQYLPFFITTFGGQYGANGTIPPGGALIYIATSTVEQGYLPSIMTTQLMSAMDITTTTLVVDGVTCPTAEFEAAYAPGHTSKNISVYCERGSELWEIFLSYGAGDPAMATHISDFNEVLGTMKFLP